MIKGKLNSRPGGAVPAMQNAGIRVNLYLYSILGLLCSASPACGSETWSVIYPGGENDRIAAIQETADGGCIVAGFTNDWGGNNCFWLLRLDEKGSLVWKRAYNDGGNFINSGLLIKQNPGDGYVVACTLPFGPGNEDILVLKLLENGDIEWQKRLGGTGNDRACFIRQTRDGGCIIGGWTNVSFNGQNYDCLLVKLDIRGETQWQNTYGGAYSDQATSILQADDGGYLMVGWTYSFSQEEQRDIWLLKLQGDGALQWQKVYQGSKHDSNYSIKQSSDGLYIVESCNFFQDRYEVLTLLLRQDGALELQKNYSGKHRVGCGQLYAAFQTKDEGYVMAGGANPTCEGNRDIVIMKRQDDGTTAWVRSYGGKADDYAEAVIQTLDGGYILAGWTYSFGFENRNIWVLRVDGRGNIPDQEILQTHSAAEEGFEILAVPAALDMRPVAKKLTLALDRHMDLNLYVSGPLGRLYVFPCKEIPALREALAQALAVAHKQKSSSGIQDLAKITNGTQMLTISARGDREGRGGIGLYLREMPSRVQFADNPLIVSCEQAQKIIDALAPDNLKTAFNRMQKKEPGAVQ